MTDSHRVNGVAGTMGVAGGGSIVVFIIVIIAVIAFVGRSVCCCVVFEKRFVMSLANHAISISITQQIATISSGSWLMASIAA